MIPVKICHFCQQPTQYAPLPTPASIGSLKLLRVHFCFQCSAEFVFWTDDDNLASVHLYATVNDKMYRWSTSPSEKMARLWYVETPGIPGKEANKGVVLLRNFEDHPDITPSNVEEKIRFMLPFL